nr:PAS domain-containing protein [Massilia rhizosphaerae]
MDNVQAAESAAAMLDILAMSVSAALENAALRREIRTDGDAHDASAADFAFERKLLRTLVDNIPFRTDAKDRASQFLFGNNRMARLAGAGTPAQLIGKTDYDFFPAELAAKDFADEKQVTGSGQSLFDYEELVEDQDTGELGWTVTSKVLLRDDDGTVNGIVGIGYDVTQRKRLEERLRERTQALELANARLEAEKDCCRAMRAPVTFMKQDIGLDDIRMDLDALFSESREGLQRVKHIVQNLKDFSRPGGTTKEMTDLEQGLGSTLNVA